MTDPTCPRNEEAVGWALHSLEPDEEMAVLMHLPECSSCRNVAGDAEEVLSYLGAAVEQIDPPPALKDRLMSLVAETPQEPAPAPAAAPEAVHEQTPPTPVPTDQERRGRSRPTDNRPGRGSRWSRRGRQVVAGALALVAVVAIGVLGVRNSQLQAERDAQIAQSQNLQDLLDQFDRPGVQHALLAREDGSTIAAVVVDNGRPQVFPIGMPANSVDRDTYVLWGVAQGANPAPLGTFDVTGNPEGLLTVGSSVESQNYVAYAISLEPGRTAPAVPTAVVASGPVAA